MPHAAKCLKEYATRRNLIDACYKIQNKAFEPSEDFASLLGDAQRSILEVEDGCSPGESFCSMKDLTQKSIDRYAAAKTRQEIKAIPTGFPTIVRITGGGFRGSKLIIIAARPRIGKTALMLNMASNMAKRGRQVGIFSLEMDMDELDDRWMASESGVNSMRLVNGMDEQEWERVVMVADKKSEWPILVDDQGGLTVDDLARRAKKMRQMGVEVIFIDQLSKIKGDNKQSEWEKNTKNVVALSNLKKELRLPIVLLAQSGRKTTESADKKPTLETLKMTGALEEEADVVLLGHRKFVYSKLPADADNAEWEIAKQRQGPEWNVEMKWDAKRTKFYEEARV
jgi:replicative DNA helicase